MDADAELAALQARLRALEQRAADRRAGVEYVHAEVPAEAAPAAGNPYRGERKGWPEPNRPTMVPADQRGVRIDPHLRQRYSVEPPAVGAAAVAPRGRVEIPTPDNGGAPAGVSRQRWEEEIDGAEAQVAAEIDADYQRYLSDQGVRTKPHPHTTAPFGAKKHSDISECGASVENPSVPTPEHDADQPCLVVVGASDGEGKPTGCNFVVRVPGSPEAEAEAEAAADAEAAAAEHPDPIDAAEEPAPITTEATDVNKLFTPTPSTRRVVVSVDSTPLAPAAPLEDHRPIDAMPDSRASSALVALGGGEDGLPMEHLAIYCESIGMDPYAFPDSLLLWIARQGIRAPLPEEWCSHDGPDGWTYYIHTTGMTQWAHPLDAHYATLFKQHKLLLMSVLEEFDALDAAGWSLPLPRTETVLVTDSFLSDTTFIWLHKSWAVGDMEYPGEPLAIHVEEVPVQMIRDLAECTVSPATPGLVLLRDEPNETGAVVQTWLEVKAEGDELYLVFREHAAAPAAGHAMALVQYGAVEIPQRELGEVCGEAHRHPPPEGA